MLTSNQAIPLRHMHHSFRIWKITWVMQLLLDGRPVEKSTSDVIVVD